MAWHRETTAKDMISLTEHHIPRSNTEVQRLLTFVQKCHALGHTQLQYTWRHAWLLKRCRAAVIGLRWCWILRSRGQPTDYLEPSEPLDVRCGAQEAVSFMAQYQIEIIKCYQKDTKAPVKISPYSTALRLKHECWPHRLPPSRSEGGRAASSAACVRYTSRPSIVADQGYGAAEA